MAASVSDVEVVTELLGRTPQCEFDVVVRDRDGSPVVIRNAPLLDDGTPMPTRYWLVGRNGVRGGEPVGVPWWRACGRAGNCTCRDRGGA